MATIRPEVTFETFPDVSRKLDTIIQLLQGPDGLATLKELVRQSNQVTAPVVSMDQGIFESQPSLLSKQKWGEIGMQPQFGSAYVDPLVALQSGTMSWNEGCTSCQTPQTIVPTLSAPSVNQVDIDQAMNKSYQLLEQILRKVSAPRVETRTLAANPMPDLTNTLFTINEEMSQIRQLLSIRPEQKIGSDMLASFQQSVVDNSDEVVERLDQLQVNLTQHNDILQQVYDAVSQLVGQANDNTTMIQDIRANNSGLRQVLEEVNSLLIQNINHRGSDIQQLMDENISLREHLQKLVHAIEREAKKGSKR